MSNRNLSSPLFLFFVHGYSCLTWVLTWYHSLLIQTSPTAFLLSTLNLSLRFTLNMLVFLPYILLLHTMSVASSASNIYGGSSSRTNKGYQIDTFNPYCIQMKTQLWFMFLLWSPTTITILDHDQWPWIFDPRARYISLMEPCRGHSMNIIILLLRIDATPWLWHGSTI